MNNSMWKYLEETDKFLQDVHNEIESIKDELSSGHIVLNSSDQMLREYTFNVGKIEGLKYLQDYIERIDTDDSESIESSTISGEDDN